MDEWTRDGERRIGGGGGWEDGVDGWGDGSFSCCYVSPSTAMAGPRTASGETAEARGRLRGQLTNAALEGARYWDCFSVLVEQLM